MTGIDGIADELEKRGAKAEKFSYFAIFLLVAATFAGVFGFYNLHTATERTKADKESKLNSILEETTKDFEDATIALNRSRKDLRNDLSSLEKKFAKSQKKKKKSKGKKSKKSEKSNKIDDAVDLNLQYEDKQSGDFLYGAITKDQLIIEYVKDFLEHADDYRSVTRPKIEDPKYRAGFFSAAFSESESKFFLRTLGDLTEEANVEDGVQFPKAYRDFIDQIDKSLKVTLITAEDLPSSLSKVEKDLDKIAAADQKLASKGYRFLANDDGKTFTPTPILNATNQQSGLISVYNEWGTRITIIVLLFITLQVFVSIYRYNSRLSGFYFGRSDALRLWQASGGKNITGEELRIIMQSMSPENYDFGKQLISPIDHSFEFIKQYTNKK